jgi:adenosylmethionine-8-amino-7-oxononanoate aminotransferase
VPPAGYLERLREITRKHGILLIFDEVITGFGRLGAATAAEFFGVTPDIITLAKGLTNGAVPMGAVVASRALHDTVIASAAPGIEFFHGYTYSGHPLAAAAGLATLALYREESLFARANGLALPSRRQRMGFATRRMSQTSATWALWPASNWRRARGSWRAGNRSVPPRFRRRAVGACDG